MITEQLKKTKHDDIALLRAQQGKDITNILPSTSKGQI